MTSPDARMPTGSTEGTLPGRDWVLLPLIGLLTVCFIAVSTELIATMKFPRHKAKIEDCLVLDHPATGARGMANCKCFGSVNEGPLVEYSFNSCGDRSELSCDAKSAGTYRIVAVGASQAFGYGVASESTIDALLGPQLSSQIGRRVEIYNQGMARFGYPHVVALRFGETLAARPDLILWILTPHDVEAEPVATANQAVADPAPSASRGPARPSGVLSKTWSDARSEFGSRPISDAIRDMADKTRSVLLLRVLLYANRERYVRNFMMGGGDADYLKTEFSAASEQQLHYVDQDIATMEEQAASAGVPFAAVLVPNRAQAAMISTGQWPAGADPYKLNNELRAIVVRHGGVYLDILPEFRKLPDAEQGFFRVDGHLNTKGNAMVAAMLDQELNRGAIQSLANTHAADALGKEDH